MDAYSLELQIKPQSSKTKKNENLRQHSPSPTRAVLNQSPDFIENVDVFPKRTRERQRQQLEVDKRKVKEKRVQSWETNRSRSQTRSRYFRNRSRSRTRSRSRDRVTNKSWKNKRTPDLSRSSSRSSDLCDRYSLKNIPRRRSPSQSRSRSKHRSSRERETIKYLKFRSHPNQESTSNKLTKRYREKKSCSQSSSRSPSRKQNLAICQKGRSRPNQEYFTESAIRRCQKKKSRSQHSSRSRSSRERKLANSRKARSGLNQETFTESRIQYGKKKSRSLSSSRSRSSKGKSSTYQETSTKSTKRYLKKKTRSQSRSRSRSEGSSRSQSGSSSQSHSREQNVANCGKARRRTRPKQTNCTKSRKRSRKSNSTSDSKERMHRKPKASSKNERKFGKFLLATLDEIVANTVLLPKLAEAAQMAHSKARCLEQRNPGNGWTLLKDVRFIEHLCDVEHSILNLGRKDRKELSKTLLINVQQLIEIGKKSDGYKESRALISPSSPDVIHISASPQTKSKLDCKMERDQVGNQSNDTGQLANQQSGPQNRTVTVLGLLKMLLAMRPWLGDLMTKVDHYFVSASTMDNGEGRSEHLLFDSNFVHLLSEVRDYMAKNLNGRGNNLVEACYQAIVSIISRAASKSRPLHSNNNKSNMANKNVISSMLHSGPDVLPLFSNYCLPGSLHNNQRIGVPFGNQGKVNQHHQHNSELMKRALNLLPSVPPSQPSLLPSASQTFLSQSTRNLQANGATGSATSVCSVSINDAIRTTVQETYGNDAVIDRMTSEQRKILEEKVRETIIKVKKEILIENAQN